MDYVVQETSLETRDQTMRAMALALRDDPLYQWFVAEQEPRERWVRVVIESVAQLCKDGGRIYSVLDSSGIPVGGICVKRFESYHVPFLKTVRFLGSLILKPHPFLPSLKMVIPGVRYNAEFERQHIGKSHWHVYALGVSPEHQGKGLGARLVQQAIQLTDQDGWSLYLETTKESNVVFYQKQGMAVLSKVELPFEAPPFWRMERRGGES